MVSTTREWMSVGARESISFDDLFLAEYARVVAIARRVLGDGHEAEDVAQEVFCSFYGKHSADAPYAAAWLHRASAHTALNTVRGRRRRQRRETGDAIGRARLESGAETSLDPQQALLALEQARELRFALTRLPEKSAAVLALRYSGLSYAEVATALAVGVNQVGTLLRRAEAALRKEMTDDTSR